MGVEQNPRIGIVGPCGSGKSTLVQNLKDHRVLAEIHHIAQEHSYVDDMWQRLVKPDILIYLDASYETATNRRKLNWTYQEYQEQCLRLRHSKEHAALIVNTDNLSAFEVYQKTADFLILQGINFLRKSE